MLIFWLEMVDSFKSTFEMGYDRPIGLKFEQYAWVRPNFVQESILKPSPHSKFLKSVNLWLYLPLKVSHFRKYRWLWNTIWPVMHYGELFWLIPNLTLLDAYSGSNRSKCGPTQPRNGSELVKNCNAFRVNRSWKIGNPFSFKKWTENGRLVEN